MKRALLILGALLATLAASPSWAQLDPPTAQVIGTCGTASYVAGVPRPVTMDTTGILCTAGGGASGVVIMGSASSTVGIVPASAINASSVVLKGGPGNLYSVSGSTSTAAPFIMLFDATSAPVDGAVTPYLCYGPVAGNAPFSIVYAPGPPVSFTTGITMVLSSTGCTTKTATTGLFISGQVK